MMHRESGNSLFTKEMLRKCEFNQELIEKLKSEGKPIFYSDQYGFVKAWTLEGKILVESVQLNNSVRG